MKKTKTKYVSLADYNTMLSKQNFKCPICHGRINESNKKLYVGRTKTLKGILCVNCNNMLTFLNKAVVCL